MSVVAGPDTTAEPIEVTTAEVLAGTSDDCGGLGTPGGSATLTWVENAKLWESNGVDPPHCLLELTGPVASVRWGPSGDRLLINGHIVVGGPTDGTTITADVRARFSRPEGTNLFWTDSGGRLWKYASEVSTIVELPGVGDHRRVVPMPGGELLVVVSGAEGAATELHVLDTTGQQVATLVTGLSGAHISNATFSRDGRWLYLVLRPTGEGETGDRLEGIRLPTTTAADAGRRLFRLQAGDGSFHQRLAGVHTHPTQSGVLALNSGSCDTGYLFGVLNLEDPLDGAPLVNGDGLAVGVLDAAGGTAVAVLPNPCGQNDAGSLVLVAPPAAPGQANQLVVIAESVDAVAVRAPAASNIVDSSTVVLDPIEL